MLEKLEALEKRYKELEGLLSNQEIISKPNEYQRYAKELASISDIVAVFRNYNDVKKEIEKLELEKSKHKDDAEFLLLIKEEIEKLNTKLNSFYQKLEESLIEEDKDIGKDVIVEIRAGTGGEEAGIFAGDLYRMYSKYAISKGWGIEIMSSRSSQLNGFKEIIFAVKGKNVYGTMKFESGVHRVQRVPLTEASGRIHTSAATVAVLPEPEEVDVRIDSKDLKIDVYRATGPGGQGVNTTDSAVRITHLSSGMVVTCQDERSQLKNKNKAMRVLRARLLDDARTKQAQQISDERRSMVKTGDRSEKIRTYNFSEHRVTDHRIGFTIYKLDSFMEGDIGEMIDALRKQELKLKRESLNVKSS